LRNALRKIGIKISRAGLVIGEGGNISARKRRAVYIKRRGADMEKAKAADYIRLDAKTGRPVRRGDRPSTEIHMHLACYGARPDIGAVIHTHPVFSTAAAYSPVRARPVTYELEVNLGSSVARIGYFRPGTIELARAVGRAVKRHNAVLLERHGLITVGRDPEEAFLRTLAIERAVMVGVARRILCG